LSDEKSGTWDGTASFLEKAMSASQSRILSLRKLLSKESGTEGENPFPRIIDLFLQAIGLHAVEGDKADYERFRADMDQFTNRVNSETLVSDLHMIVGGALHTMEDYNQRTSKFVRQQALELQKMIAMLAEAVITMSADQKVSVAKLGEIEKSIVGVSQVEDIRALKVQLGECLKVVREEAERRKVEGQQAIASLKAELKGPDGSAREAAAPPEIDAATDLPGKRDAAMAIQAAVDAPEGKFLLVAVINRVQAVNARFGYAVGDQVLAAAANHFRKSLASHAQLFRWQGPTILAILTRSERLDQVRADVRRFADAKLESTVELGQRSVLIPVSASWCLLPVMPPQSTLLKQIDVFTAAQTSKDYV
jgi:GGDEF domain-containing protein